MNLQIFFLRGAAATVAAGAVACGALALVHPGRHVPAGPSPVAEARQTTTPPAATAVTPPAAIASANAGAASVALPPSAPNPPSARVAAAAPPPVVALAPPPHATHHAHHDHAVQRPTVMSTSRQNADKFAHTRIAGTAAIEMTPPAPPAPYVTYDPAVRPPYSNQPWYYRRVY